MKIYKSLILGACICFMHIGVVHAAGLVGDVTFVGTQPEHISGDNYNARFRVRLTNSTCNGADKKERWLHIISGAMNGKFQHNLANTRNAYSTLMSALITKKKVQIDGAVTCKDSQNVGLWRIGIGILG